MSGGCGGGPSLDDDGGGDKSNTILRAPLNLPKIPRKIGRKPPLKGTRRETLQDIARRVPVEVMRPYFNYPLRTAADAMCISVTSLKRLCRRHGVKRWPHRQLSGLNRAVTLLEAKREPSRSDPAVAEQLSQLYRRRDQIIDLAFMSDDNSSEPRENPFSRLCGEERESPGDADTMPDRMRDTMESSSGREEAPDRGLAPPPARFHRSPDETTPWWHREPDAYSWQRLQEQQDQHQHHQHQHHQHQHHQHQHHQHQHQHQHQHDQQHLQQHHQRSGEGDCARGADSVDGSKVGVWPTGHHREDQDGRGSLSRSLVDDGDSRESKGGAEGRILYAGAPSVVSNGLQGMPPCLSTHSTPMATATARGGIEQQHPATGASLEMPSRPPMPKQSPVGGGSSNGVGTTTLARAWDRKPPTGLSSVPPPHFAQLSLPPPQRHHYHLEHHRPSGDNVIGTGVAHTAAFNNLFSGAPSSHRRDGQSEAQGESAAGGDHHRFGAEEGVHGGTGQDESRPLPSIARLVEASAMLSAAGEGEWRYSQDRPQQRQASFQRVHERAGAM